MLVIVVLFDGWSVHFKQGGVHGDHSSPNTRVAVPLVAQHPQAFHCIVQILPPILEELKQNESSPLIIFWVFFGVRNCSEFGLRSSRVFLQRYLKTQSNRQKEKETLAA
ncbi:hypothetical protein CIPAW_13G070600 [Carya illinoinensis]|uniref:Uncharacterized protein n=1 Tax=Carya illinoinensis TaxID=32201 RepID=A0A8T1NQX5_CARIL|nr:hypothetical protein CIPAW_13G070600 [Carya illinoinensis]